MKRHESLIPISRQHHDGLLAARLLQREAPAYHGLPTTPAAKCKYMQMFLARQLKPHFLLEEETVFIFAQDASEQLQQQAKKLEAEHRQLEQLITALPQTTADELQDKLHEVGVLLEQHIRQEERQFFEQLQQELPEERLASLKEQVEQHRLL
ncbi:hemerythrin domain-containing protein [Pontibacter silvestris]|uniref:Hemerythrin domain-containing protein n=1 Tax=Pontibacter silvestris TaxID=2305183 RepID=A0ABW4WWU6_9BACT|nr:hemerythrin domain-containing protein [Pontibacter silvestris]MCC9136842.1 hemerythrin domain-containing protein [Pontibacter silvestris]